MRKVELELACGVGGPGSRSALCGEAVCCAREKAVEKLEIDFCTIGAWPLAMASQAGLRIQDSEQNLLGQLCRSGCMDRVSCHSLRDVHTRPRLPGHDAASPVILSTLMSRPWF